MEVMWVSVKHPLHVDFATIKLPLNLNCNFETTKITPEKKIKKKIQA